MRFNSAASFSPAWCAKRTFTSIHNDSLWADSMVADKHIGKAQRFKDRESLSRIGPMGKALESSISGGSLAYLECTLAPQVPNQRSQLAPSLAVPRKAPRSHGE